ncbi:MAG: hypothetical protein LBT54_08240, partial [Bifidobacteriaceae bacterium]|nr:hypothetical protein [Bifidobacteriaceae bacterium]
MTSDGGGRYLGPTHVKKRKRSEEGPMFRVKPLLSMVSWKVALCAALAGGLGVAPVAAGGAVPGRPAAASAVSGSKPVLTGVAAKGRTLTVKLGKWKPADSKVAYRWYRGGKVIGNARGATRKLTKRDVGARIRVKVTARSKSTGKQLKSAKTSGRRVYAKAVNSKEPTIGGTVDFDKVLTARTAKWKPKGVKLTYSWLRDGQPIPGAFKKTYRIALEDKGHKISVRITGKKAGRATVSRVSKARAVSGAPAAEYAALIANRMTDQSARLYVYRDFSDGISAFTQRMWMPTGGAAPPKMDEKLRFGVSGVSNIGAEIDFREHAWGGYVFQTGTLAAGSDRPALNYGAQNSGLDLRGAVALHFWARGMHGGETVRFYMGGLGHGGGMAYPDSTGEVSVKTADGSGWVTLDRQYTHYKIDLRGVDLSRIGAGFAWVSSATRNPGRVYAAFFMDEIYYEYPSPRAVPMFINSYSPMLPSNPTSAINGF